MNYKEIARQISLVENHAPTAQTLLENIKIKNTPVIGITGPPGAGKSTIVNNLISSLVAKDYKMAVLAVDPSSPFSRGALLGDRIRMPAHYLNPHVFIRSLATRGALGGLSAKAIEIIDVLKSADFDYIIIETVGVGQNELEIASLADITLLTLIPEGGDDIQGLKSGIMEVADIFIVNKSDRPGADPFARQLKKMLQLHYSPSNMPSIIEMIATEDKGTILLIEAIHTYLSKRSMPSKKLILLANKAWQLLTEARMENYDKAAIAQEIQEKATQPGFNLYKWVKEKIE